MLQIRKGLFETNSSSVHTLVIAADDWTVEHLPETVSYEPFVIKGDTYGRIPEAPVDSIEGKLNYIWAAVLELWGPSYSAYTENGEWLPAEKRPWVWQNEERFNLWKNHLQKMFPLAEFSIEGEMHYDVYIDHISELEPFMDALENDWSLLDLFLFSESSWFEQGGDEYSGPWEMLDYPWGELCYDHTHQKYIYLKGN